jgi:hypothetical protein
MDKELNDDFRALVEREMVALGFTPLGWKGPQLKYRLTAGDQTARELGTANLRKRVKLNPSAESAGIVREFIRNVTAVTAPEWKMPETLEECADRLLPRVGQPFAQGVPAPWSDPLPGAPGLVVNLVVDFPTTMAYVTPEMVAKSATPAAEWVARAITNLKAITRPDWLRPMGGDHGLMACHTNDSYDAARALLIGERTGDDPAGWLLAVPARDWLFARKVEMSGVPHFHRVKVLAEKAKKEQPYPISDAVYWVRPGQPWQEFKIEVDGDQVKVYPPEEFMDALGEPSEE